MEWETRRATPEDLPRMLEIFEDGRRALAGRGVDQWQDGYPQRALLEADIANGDTWLLCDGAAIVATAAFCFGEDSSYAVLHGGAWHTDGPYAALHRIAVADGQTGKGAAGKLYTHFEEMARKAGVSSLRVDTHRDNLVMQSFLQRRGFAKCGVIYLPDTGAERIAYDKQI